MDILSYNSINWLSKPNDSTGVNLTKRWLWNGELETLLRKIDGEELIRHHSKWEANWSFINRTKTIRQFYVLSSISFYAHKLCWYMLARKSQIAPKSDPTRMPLKIRKSEAIKNQRRLVLCCLFFFCCTVNIWMSIAI